MTSSPEKELVCFTIITLNIHLLEVIIYLAYMLVIMQKAYNNIVPFMTENGGMYMIDRKTFSC